MQIARCLDANPRPRGVGVVLEAEHTCMTQRGIRAPRCHHRYLGPAGQVAHRPPFPRRALRARPRAHLREHVDQQLVECMTVPPGR
jgi:hypothetical protein